MSSADEKWVNILPGEKEGNWLALEQPSSQLLVRQCDDGHQYIQVDRSPPPQKLACSEEERAINLDLVST